MAKQNSSGLAPPPYTPTNQWYVKINFLLSKYIKTYFYCLLYAGTMRHHRLTMHQDTTVRPIYFINYTYFLLKLLKNIIKS